MIGTIYDWCFAIDRSFEVAKDYAVGTLEAIADAVSLANRMHWGIPTPSSAFPITWILGDFPSASRISVILWQWPIKYCGMA
jgi:hypothetical protein